MSEVQLKPLCPLCGNIPTKYSHPFSATGAALPLEYQRCYSCELPCRYWDKITALIVELRESTALLRSALPPDGKDTTRLYGPIEKQIAANEAALKKAEGTP